MNGAPAYLSKMMDNVSLLRSNNHDIINDDKLKTITTSYNGAKHSLSKDVKICQMAAKSISYQGSRRGAGWGTPRGLGLRGGGETSIANGASGWGPPPQPNTSMARGWGQPPATNSPTSTGASAWGNASGAASSSTGIIILTILIATRRGYLLEFFVLCNSLILMLRFRRNQQWKHQQSPRSGSIRSNLFKCISSSWWANHPK